jgi:hypothetical protein
MVPVLTHPWEQAQAQVQELTQAWALAQALEQVPELVAQEQELAVVPVQVAQALELVEQEQEPAVELVVVVNNPVKNSIN